MSEIKAVLLIPTEGDPHGLLKEGPCGARPPMAGRHDGYWYEYEDDGDIGLAVQGNDGHWASPAGAPTALVLAWDGEPVAEGCLRACGMDSIFTFWRSVSESIEGGDCALAWLHGAPWVGVAAKDDAAGLVPSIVAFLADADKGVGVVELGDGRAYRVRITGRP